MNPHANRDTFLKILNILQEHIRHAFKGGMRPWHVPIYRGLTSDSWIVEHNVLEDTSEWRRHNNDVEVLSNTIHEQFKEINLSHGRYFRGTKLRSDLAIKESLVYAK